MTVAQAEKHNKSMNPSFPYLERVSRNFDTQQRAPQSYGQTK